jgi:hypothetical protein
MFRVEDNLATIRPELCRASVDEMIHHYYYHVMIFMITYGSNQRGEHE